MLLRDFLELALKHFRRGCLAGAGIDLWGRTDLGRVDRCISIVSSLVSRKLDASCSACCLIFLLLVDLDLAERQHSLLDQVPDPLIHIGLEAL